MLNVQALQPWLGRERQSVDEVSATQARRMAALLDRPDMAPGAGERLPAHWYPMLFGETAPQSRLGPDGHPERGDFLPPVPLPRRMFAGRRVRFLRDLRVGETLRKRSRIEAITPKTGRSGQMCFVTVCHRIEDADGRLALVEEQDIVYREAVPGPGAAGAATAAAPSGPPPLPEGRTVTPDAPMLFRYSAITFNAHRIHYDRDYARAEEGYPDLVVNGGLTLLLMWEHARAQGLTLRYSASRNLRPLYAGNPVRLATGTRDGLPLVQAYDHQGALAAEAVLGEAASPPGRPGGERPPGASARNAKGGL